MIFPNMQKYVVMIFREQMSLWWCAIINNTNLSCKIAEKNNIILGLSLTKTSKMRNNNIWNRPIHWHYMCVCFIFKGFVLFFTIRGVFHLF